MKILLSLFCILSTLMLFPTHPYAWDGYDYDTGHYIIMEDPAQPGEDVAIYDYNDETWHDVLSISISNDGTELEVFDYETGEYRTFEMEPLEISRENKKRG